MCPLPMLEGLIHESDHTEGRTILILEVPSDLEIIFNHISRLDTESKNAEILRLLPLLNPLAAEFGNVKRSLDLAFNKLEEVLPIRSIFFRQFFNI